jgi:tetratricopeptide (TPR) repeat protein
MAIFVDKVNKLHRLVSHHREADFQSCVAVVANQMFGSSAVYVDVKQGLTSNDIVTIPSGYIIDITEASVPRLFIVKAVIARHFPFWNTGVELFKFVTSFDGAQGAIRAFLHEQIAHDTEALTRLEEARKAGQGGDVNAYLDTAVNGNFRGLVVIDDARDELNQVLEKINADISVLELKTYEAEDGSRLYQIDTLYGEQRLAASEPAQHHNAVTTEEIFDTGEHVVLAGGAREDISAEGLDVATSLISLAQDYRSQRRYSEAKRLFKRALTIQERILGRDHPDVATSLNRLGLCYRALGNRDKAKPLFERALMAREKSLPPDNPRIATSLNNLALAYCAEGEFRFAEPLLERALIIKEAAFGPDHPRVATCLHNLAQLYRALHKHAEAEALYKRALRIWEKCLGKHHPRVATVLENYALLLTDMRRSAEADRLVARAMAIRTRQRK